MAIYTGGMRMQDEARAASKRIARQQAKAQKAETKRKGRSGLFGKIGGALMGAAAVGLTGLTGGLAAPLIMGVTSSLGKKWADEASKGGSPFGKLLKSPGQVGKIEAGGKYGYGREEAASYTKALKESRKSTWSPESMLGDIASSYVTAGMAGKLGGAKGLLKGDLSFGQALTTGSEEAWKFGGIQGAKESLLGLIPGEDALTDPETELTSEELSQSQLFGGEFESVAPEQVTTTGEYGDIIGEEGWSEYQQGGQVMDQQQLMALLALAQMQQNNAYSGTPLEEKQPSSVADMFASQGKTLGGNNTQSLSQMLGR